MSLLLASLAALFVAPAIDRATRAYASLTDALDAYVVVAIGGLALLHVLPESVGTGGLWAALAAAVGFALPMVIEKLLHRAHGLVLALAFVGLAGHAGLDGAAIAAGDGHLGVAVVVHRLPMGLLLWWAAREAWSARAGWLVLGGVAAATAGGYAVAGAAAHAFEGVGMAVFQALVIGSLVHVVVHGGRHEHATEHDHDHDHDHDHAAGPRWPAALGAALGVLTLVLLDHEEPHAGASHGAGEAFVSLALASAPALLFAYVAAGLLRAFVAPQAMGWMGGGGRVSQAGRGMLFGLPLPVCSCGVLPLYHTLVRAGVPATAGLAFLVATPELGLDAVLISVPLLGTELAVARVVAAAGVALLAALIVGYFVPAPEVVEAAPDDAEPLPLRGRLSAGIRYGLGELVDHTLPWILLGLALAAFFEPILSDGALAALPALVQVPVFALVGIPLYVCASGATPLAAMLIAKGVTPGAALAFLLTGPATNATTFGVLSQLHGRKVAVVFGMVVTVLAVGVGWGVDGFVQPGGIPDLSHVHDEASWLQIGSLAGCVVLLLASTVRQGPRGMVAQITEALHPV